MKRAAAVLARALAMVAALIVLAWLLSRVISDRWWCSQWALWVPTFAYGAGALLAWGASWLVSLGGGRRGNRRAGSRTRAAAALGVAVIAAYACAIELRYWRAVIPASPAPPGRSVRVLDWNVSGITDEAAIAAVLNRESPDVAVLVNPHSAVAWNHVLAALGPDVHVVRQNLMIVASRVPVTGHGFQWLGLPEAMDGKGRPEPGAHFDPGRALFVSLDTTAALGKPTTLWVIDMPSDERLSRWALARRARDAIDRWAPTGDPAPRGFPAPGLVVGDFNIPRGSASLSLITGGLRNAFNDAGWGWSATWPREGPVFHIDQTFVAAGRRAAEYRVFDPGTGSHRAQIAVIAPDP